jgi:hypothetical protein
MDVILIARIYDCSREEQRVLSQVLLVIIAGPLQSTAENFIDPPDAFSSDGELLSATAAGSDSAGFSLGKNFKKNAEFLTIFG